MGSQGMRSGPGQFAQQIGVVLAIVALLSTLLSAEAAAQPIPRLDETAPVPGEPEIPETDIKTAGELRQAFINRLPKRCQDAIEGRNPRASVHFATNDSGLPFWHPDNPGGTIDMGGGGAGPVFAFIPDFDPFIIGTDGPDRIIGSDGFDTICAGDGDDFVEGAVGIDSIHGQGGNDELFGQAGSDRINGGEGTDTIKGGRGPDILCGGEDFDFLEGGPANDTIFESPQGGSVDFGAEPGVLGTPMARDEPCPF